MAEKEVGIVVGVGAVIFRDDEVLLIQRGKAPFLGAWSIPGGRLHFGEALEAAVLREVREETAVEARLSGFLGVYEVLPKTTSEDGFPGHIVIVDYYGEWLAGAPRAGDDAAAAGFFPLATALGMVSWDETRSAIEKAVSLRR